MVSKIKSSFIFGVLLVACSAHSQIIVSSRAKGNDGIFHDDTRTFLSLSDWANAGYLADTNAIGNRDSWDPPESAYVSHTWFDQSVTPDAQLHATGVMRQPYRGRYYNEVFSTSHFSLQYKLRVENLSGQEINLVFGNSLHGTFGTRDQGVFNLQQRLLVSNFNPVDGEIIESETIHSSNGCFNGFVHNADIVDSYYGQFTGREVGMFQIIGEQVFGIGASESFNVSHSLSLGGGLTGSDFGGLVTYDFGSTGHILVNGYDRITGANLTNQLRVTVEAVPEPATVFAFLGVLGLVRRKKSQSAR